MVTFFCLCRKLSRTAKMTPNENKDKILTLREMYLSFMTSDFPEITKLKHKDKLSRYSQTKPSNNFMMSTVCSFSVIDVR